jgi:hypothetical protein
MSNSNSPTAGGAKEKANIQRGSDWNENLNSRIADKRLVP